MATLLIFPGSTGKIGSLKVHAGDLSQWFSCSRRITGSSDCLSASMGRCHPEPKCGVKVEWRPGLHLRHSRAERQPLVGFARFSHFAKFLTEGPHPLQFLRVLPDVLYALGMERAQPNPPLNARIDIPIRINGEAARTCPAMLVRVFRAFLFLNSWISRRPPSVVWVPIEEAARRA